MINVSKSLRHLSSFLPSRCQFSIPIFTFLFCNFAVVGVVGVRGFKLKKYSNLEVKCFHIKFRI